MTGLHADLLDWGRDNGRPRVSSPVREVPQSGFTPHPQQPRCCSSSLPLSRPPLQASFISGRTTRSAAFIGGREPSGSSVTTRGSFTGEPNGSRAARRGVGRSGFSSFVASSAKPAATFERKQSPRGPRITPSGRAFTLTKREAGRTPTPAITVTTAGSRCIRDGATERAGTRATIRRSRRKEQPRRATARPATRGRGCSASGITRRVSRTRETLVRGENVRRAVRGDTARRAALEERRPAAVGLTGRRSSSADPPI